VNELPKSNARNKAKLPDAHVRGKLPSNSNPAIRYSTMKKETLRDPVNKETVDLKKKKKKKKKKEENAHKKTHEQKGKLLWIPK
jgi:hypothetical protein